MPRGFLTEDGPRPELTDRYSAREQPTSSYPEGTFANAQDSDATLWFGETDTPGPARRLRHAAS
ncbi:MAG TPA: putative molybdenum carrier protein [Isosphaeraceae bacterium]|nr:putative molybdenum carrier protein [Isosphaeraceae bacterium]